MTNSKSTAVGLPYGRQRQRKGEKKKKKKDLYVVPRSVGGAGAAEQWAEENIWEITNQNMSDSEIQDDDKEKNKEKDQTAAYNGF